MPAATGLYEHPRLTNISLGYTNDRYIAEQAFPVVGVAKDEGKIVSYGMDNLRIVSSERSQGARAKQVTHTVSAADHYILEEHTLEEFVSREEMENADSPISPMIDATENLTDRILVEKEKALADVLSDTAVLTQNDTLTGTEQWNDVDSNPEGDILAGVKAVKAGCGMMPNTLIVAWNAWEELKANPTIRDRVKYAEVVDDQIMSAFVSRAFPGIRNVLIGSAMYNNSVEGGTDTLAEIWDKFAVVAYVAERPTQKSRSLGYTYARDPRRQVRTLPMDSGSYETFSRRSSVVSVSDKYDQVVVDATCAYLIKNAVA